ncbi:TnpV protein [Tissierella carlieri]|uniref:TnpV protein n=1 Tax=Tissierella carlieri TaxID=689904 RepID=UPI003B84B6D1
MKKPLVELEYQEKDGIMYPQIEVENMPLGKYGMIFHNYLKENHEKRFTWLMMNGDLMDICRHVEKEAKEKFNLLEKQLLEKDPIPNPMDTYESYRHRDMIRREAEEIVLKEIVYKVR